MHSFQKYSKYNDIITINRFHRLHIGQNRFLKYISPYRFYKSSNVTKNFLFDDFNISDSDGVFIIFDAREKEHIEPKWKETVISIIDNITENKVALIGIRVSEASDWSQLLEEFNINKYLENQMISLLFFKIGIEYRLEIYDQLEVMLNTIKDLN
jgi:hypothetical protein